MGILTATIQQGKTTGMKTLRFVFLVLVGWWVLGFVGLVFPKEKAARSVMQKSLIAAMAHVLI